MLQAAKVQPIRPEQSHRYYVFLWKDQLDADSPLWKRLFFRFIYRPFNQFCRFKLKLPTFNAEECCKCGKRLLWTEHQGIVCDEWQAIQCAQTANWGYHGLPYNGMLAEATDAEGVNHNYPLSSANGKYKENGHSTVPIPKLDLVQLAGKIAKTDGLVEHFKSPV